MMIDLGKGLLLKNPVLLASGTASFGEELSKLYDVSLLGGLVTKAISLEPRSGNPPPRIVETPSGMINAIGLENVGVEQFIKIKLPFLREKKITTIVNVVGKSVEDYCEVVKRLENEDEISGYEINLSCPNVKGECIIFGTSAKETNIITQALRGITNRHLMIKLTPNVTTISEIARAAEDGGADSVSLINTVIGMAVDYKTRKPKIKNITGGLSGPAIKPIALAKIWETFQVVKIPIVGMGGITSFEDAMEFFVVGAKAIQIGTFNFIEPLKASLIANQIENHFSSDDELSHYVGSLLIS